jgi:hypothetical protein
LLTHEKIKRDVLTKEIIRDLKKSLRTHFESFQKSDGYKTWAIEKWLRKIKRYLRTINYPLDDENDCYKMLILVRRRVTTGLKKDLPLIEMKIKENKKLYYDYIKKPKLLAIQELFKEKLMLFLWNWYVQSGNFKIKLGSLGYQEQRVAIKTFEFYSEISGICPVVKDSPE